MTTSYTNLIECQAEQGRVRLLLEACEARLAAVEAERDAAQAGEARAVEALEKMLIGGNHLASALIHLLGDDFPEYETDFNEACEILNDPIKYDLWVCWAMMMRERDAMNDPKLAAALRAGKGGE